MKTEMKKESMTEWQEGRTKMEKEKVTMCEKDRTGEKERTSEVGAATVKI